jgi:hypothetical protein
VLIDGDLTASWNLQRRHIIVPEAPFPKVIQIMVTHANRSPPSSELVLIESHLARALMKDLSPIAVTLLTIASKFLSATLLKAATACLACSGVIHGGHSRSLLRPRESGTYLVFSTLLSHGLPTQAAQTLDIPAVRPLGWVFELDASIELGVAFLEANLVVVVRTCSEASELFGATFLQTTARFPEGEASGPREPSTFGVLPTIVLHSLKSEPTVTSNIGAVWPFLLVNNAECLGIPDHFRCELLPS